MTEIDKIAKERYQSGHNSLMTWERTVMVAGWEWPDYRRKFTYSKIFSQSLVHIRYPINNS